MMDDIRKIVALMPTLKRYSVVLLLYLVTVDPEHGGIVLKQWHIMEKTGLCQRSLQLAIKELEDKGLLLRDNERNSEFTVLL